MREHPLAVWLEKQGESVPEFARRCEIAHNTVYMLIKGSTPNLDTVRKVEEGTGGAVTMRQMSDWLILPKD